MATKGQKRYDRDEIQYWEKKINILGALDIENLSAHITLTEETCNAERVIEFLQKVRGTYSDAKIVVVLDNARCNYAKAT